MMKLPGGIQVTGELDLSIIIPALLTFLAALAAYFRYKTDEMPPRRRKPRKPARTKKGLPVKGAKDKPDDTP